MITDLDKAEQYVDALTGEEEGYLLTALLRSVSIDQAKKAADEAGYNLEQQ